MAKILVADDNSNIQKMVGLALKDQGIDVVAVGNGEAAVRKISDVHPDLVLADVFMPVRNGYEVCQYVKGDSALAHIPVILLVGAFDPLDEQEAQRVGADGVLKKPFVPPDPLISMVKSALARAGVAVGGVPAAPPPVEEPVRVAEMLAPRKLPSMPAVQEFPTNESEVLPEVAAEMPQPVKIDAGSEPLAFSSLLETSNAEPEQDETMYAATARPELERDFHSGNQDEEEVEDQEEEKESSSWRRDAGDGSLEAEEVASKAPKDWREEAFAEAPARKSKHEQWSPQKEISRFEEAAEVGQTVSSVATETPSAEMPHIPQLPTAPFTEDAWATALNQKSAEAATLEAAQTVPPPQTQSEAAPALPPAMAEPVKDSESPWYSAVSSPWDAEAQKASKLAATWDDAAPSTAAAANAAPEPVSVPEASHAEDPAATVDILPTSLSQEFQEKIEEAALPAATVEALREEAQQIAETAAQEAPAQATGSKAQEPSMEDLVAKVLAKMSPDMLQAVTREILKPVVESMVRDELNAKK